MGEKFKIIFIGSQRYGAQCLRYLIKNKENVEAIFTFEPEPHELWKNEIIKIANEENILLIKTHDLGKYKDFITKLAPDAIFVIGWRTLIPKEIYSLPMFGCIGVHGSLLPKYRGFAPLNWATINGEKEIGISMFYIGEGVDKGKILAQKKFKIELSDNMKQIKEKFDKSIVELFIEQFPKIKNGEVNPKEQNEDNASFGCLRRPEDGEINWNGSAEKIYNFIRALDKPYPGAFTYCNGKKIFIWGASLIDKKIKYIGIPGSIVKIIKDKGAWVFTGNDIILIERIQPENGDEICAGNYFKSIRVRLGINYSLEIENLKEKIQK